MNKQKFFFILVSLGSFFFVPDVFAADVSVVGHVGNPDTTTAGSRVIFKESASQQVAAETIVDPMGRYIIFVPEGTYDITVVPPEGSSMQPVTKSKQAIMSDTESAFILPSTKNPVNSLLEGIPMNALYAAVGGSVLVFIVGIVYFVWKKNR